VNENSLLLKVTAKKKNEKRYDVIKYVQIQRKNKNLTISVTQPPMIIGKGKQS